MAPSCRNQVRADIRRSAYSSFRTAIAQRENAWSRSACGIRRSVLSSGRPVGAGTRRWKTIGVPDRWPDYSEVRFRSDQHRADGATEGRAGYIVEVCDDADEVEVTEPETGQTLLPGAVPDAGLDLIPGRGPVS
jgi:hypothetical protein